MWGTETLLLTAAAAKTDGDIDQVADSLIAGFWKTMPGFAMGLLRLSVLVVPLAMVILGLVGWLCPPKEANWHLGYRTRRAMGTEDSWFFAQRLRGMIWTIAGGAMLIPSLILRGLMAKGSMDYASRMVITYVGVQLGVLILSLITMRIVMVVRYDRKGNRREGKKTEKVKA